MSALPHNPAGWVRLFADADIPARGLSLRGLASMHQRVDEVSSRKLAALVLRDPLLTARLFAHAATFCAQRQSGEVTTVDGIVLTLGITRVIEALAGAPALEAKLEGRPEALEGLFEVMLRARQAAHFAADFACHRQDREVEEIAVAGMLYDVAEMLLWCEAPEAALEIRRRMRADPGLRSRAIQQEATSAGCTLPPCCYSRRLCTRSRRLIEGLLGYLQPFSQLTAILLREHVQAHGREHGTEHQAHHEPADAAATGGRRGNADRHRESEPKCESNHGHHLHMRVTFHMHGSCQRL